MRHQTDSCWLGLDDVLAREWEAYVAESPADYAAGLDLPGEDELDPECLGCRAWPDGCPACPHFHTHHQETA